MRVAGLNIFVLLFLIACTQVPVKPAPKINREPGTEKRISHPTCSRTEAKITGLMLSIKTKDQKNTNIDKIAIFPYRVGDKLILPAKLPREVLWFDDKLVMFAEIMHDGEDSFVLAIISFEKKNGATVTSHVSSIGLKTCENGELTVRGPRGQPVTLTAKIEFINDIIVK